MQSKHQTLWKPIGKTPTLKQACLRALQQGACYIHFASYTQQPCVIIPLQKWLSLLEIKNKNKCKT